MTFDPAKLHRQAPAYEMGEPDWRLLAQLEIVACVSDDFWVLRDPQTARLFLYNKPQKKWWEVR